MAAGLVPCFLRRGVVPHFPLGMEEDEVARWEAAILIAEALGMSLTTLQQLFAASRHASLGTGHQAAAMSPWVPSLLLVFVFAVVFLLVRLAWSLIKSRLKKPR
ncbi:MAG: hypothetical protein NTY77_20700 [Elusimicrobia bacterium]|nr:hypothetical protein [Elusimicrobiota bacterium]